MKKMLLSILWWMMVGLSSGVAQTVTCEQTDSLMIVSLLADSSNKTTLDFARKFINVPYVAHTLEVNLEEQLVINTRELDCTTFVETVTALTLCAQQDKRTFADYNKMLTLLRYRHGALKGYPSRLHYFSDWIIDNQEMGFVRELQQPNPPFTAIQQIHVDYMSKHPQSYKALAANPSLIKDIVRDEQSLTGKTARYIPKQEVKNTHLLRNTIQDGDIIAITCSKQGLEIAHLGFAVWQKDGLHLLNASILHKKVVLEPMLLRQYLMKHKTHTGIRIIRINQLSKQ